MCSFAGSFEGLSLLQALVSGSSATSVAAGSSKHGCCSHYGWVDLLIVIPSQGLAQPWIYYLRLFFTWCYSRKQQISVGKISQHPRDVTSPTSRFQGAQTKAGLLLAYTESNWPLICSAMCFLLGYLLPCLFWFLTVEFWSPFFVHLLSISSLFSSCCIPLNLYLEALWSACSLWRDYTNRCSLPSSFDRVLTVLCYLTIYQSHILCAITSFA